MCPRGVMIGDDLVVGEVDRLEPDPLVLGGFCTASQHIAEPYVSCRRPLLQLLAIETPQTKSGLVWDPSHDSG